MKLFRTLLVASFLCCLSGCIFIPILDSVSQVGFSKGDREKLLPPEVKRFHDSLYWQNVGMAMSWVDPEHADEIKKRLLKQVKDTKPVESKVTSIDFNKDSDGAEVSITLKTYNINTLIVSEQASTEHWEFGMRSGWKVMKIEDVK